jgi:outer membrane protein assembly factor BamE (lipoprotein component of BamABCDE complex)
MFGNYMKTLLMLTLLLSPTVVNAITYPYEAPAERRALIKTQFKAIKPGMSSADVIGLLKNPDKTTPLYEPKIKNPRTIGSTMWYVVSQHKEHGSVNEVKRVAIAVRLDLKNNVTRIDRFNL